jgi:hypothetical protein
VASQDTIRRLSIYATSQGVEKVTSDLEKLDQAQKKVSTSSTTQERSTLSLEKSLNSIERRYVDGVRQVQEYERVKRSLTAAVANDPALYARAETALVSTAEKLGVLGTQSAAAAAKVGLARHELINLSRQAQDVAVSLGSGQSFGTVLLQQGSQIADVFASSTGSVRGFFSQAIEWGGRFITSTAGVVASITTIGAAGGYSAIKWNEAKVDVERALIGIGQQSGATADDIERIAKSASTTSKITTGDARELSVALLQTGKIGVEQIEMLVSRGKDFAKVLGVDIPDAAKVMAEAFSDAGRGVDILGERFSISAGTRQNVRDLQAQFNFAGAQKALQEAIIPSLDRASNASSTISEAWGATAKFFSDINADFNRGLDRLFGNNPASERLSVAQNRLGQLQATQVDRASDRSRFGGAETFVDRQLTRDLAAARAEVAKLQSEVKKVDDQNFVNLGNAALKVAENIAPSISNVRNLRNTLAGLEKTLSTPQALAGMSQEQVSQLQEARNLTADQLSYVTRIRSTYRGVSTEVASQLDILSSQAGVAGARTQDERLSAQYAADYKTAMASGKSAAEAVALASSQRRVNEAGLAKQAEDTVQASRDQLRIASQVTLQGRAQAQAQATYNQILAQTGDAQMAATVAQNQYKGSMVEIERSGRNIVASLSDQADVASAIGGRAKVNAQAQATYNDMVRQGYSATVALSAADEVRRAGLGAINAAMAEQLASLQDQNAIVGASTGAQKIAAQSQAAYNKAIRDGASESDAAAISQQVYANGVAAANAAVQNQIYEIEKQADITRVSGTSMEAATRAAWAYSDALRSGADEAHAFALQQATLNAETAKYEKSAARRRASDAGLEYNQFSTDTPQLAFAKQSFGKGGFEWEDQQQFGLYAGRAIPNAQGYEAQVNRMLSGSRNPGSISGSIDELLNRRSGFGVGGFGPNMFDDAMGQTFTRLLNLLPDNEKIGKIEQGISKLYEQPQTLARDELIKQLNDQLKQLKEATENNTDALNAQLDPIFSQGHEYLNSLRIGYYKAAKGFDGIVTGGTPGVDSVPINIMAQQGERVQVHPPGSWSGSSSVANDNSRNVTQNITQNITINEADRMSRLTARQRAQGFITTAARAAG